MAAAILAPEFQETFNLNKGSIPARLNADMSRFDDCAKLSARDFVATSKSGTLVPSIAHGMAVSSAVESAMKDVVSQYWNADTMTAEQAMDRLVWAATAR
jgi:glucose/mannose transport system substrate-binding protein